MAVRRVTGAGPAADERLAALQASVVDLRGLVAGLDPAQLGAPAYPSEWTIADVLSHLGSGAVIMRAGLDNTLAGRETPSDFAPAVWDTWNAKSPEAKAADALESDRALMERLAGLTDDEAARFRFSLGPMTLDLAGFVGMRLNEHCLHTWDIRVVSELGAVVNPGAAALVVDNVGMIARYAGKPTGDRVVHVRTSAPARDLTVSLGPESVAIGSGEGDGPPDIELPAEAFVRLVYGRLDPAHTPAVQGDPAVLDDLRRAFPGV